MARLPLVPRLINEYGDALRLAEVRIVEHYTPEDEVPVYAAETGGAVLTQPLATDAQGEVEVWTEFGGTVDVVFTDGGLTVDRRGNRRPFTVPVVQTRSVGAAAASSAAYEEFLADSQTPYFMHAINPPVNYLIGTHYVVFIGEGDKFDQPLTPAQPLPALVNPFVGPGIVTDPIGYNPDDQYYTGRGAFRALKTGTLQIHWSLTTEHPAGVEGTRVQMYFAGEDGTNQMYANGSGPSTAGVLGPTSNDPQRVGVSGIATLTISEFDRLDDLPYSVLFPSYPSPNYPNQFSIDGGMMPLGWDIYPWFTIENHAVDLTALTIDHLVILIRKIA